MNPSYHSSDWGGKAILVLAVAILGIIAAAFVLGGATSEQLQWLNPDIAKAVANFKQQQARNLELNNDKLQEEIRGQKIANDRQQSLNNIEAADKQAWSTMMPQMAQTLIGAVGDAIRSLPFSATVIGLVLIYLRYGSRRMQSDTIRNPLARARILGTAARTLGFEMESVANASDQPSVTADIVPPYTSDELDRNRVLRNWGRTRARELRQALAQKQNTEGGDALVEYQ